SQRCPHIEWNTLLHVTDRILVHFACKNGLMHHVERLLYYGADINAQNVNGNTPLHVCAVNNRPECARVLLLRGADASIVNKQGQTALHVAHIVGNADVAEIIQNHNPACAVPYRGVPTYNPKRRLTSTLARKRSLSQNSVSSNNSEYRAPNVSRSSQIVPSPTPSRITLPDSQVVSECGTLRRFPTSAVKTIADGQEVNVPRILVIPRGPKGFGFILRGAKDVDAELNFEPSLLVPALQFFEGVDMSGMAMKAGLRPGDFLLQINGVDVRTASHDQVVRLIHASGDTITLKVITVDPSASAMPRLGA
uniref:PDZ domain-containing protein n=1 Tax=Parascaris univalens TaxID=6257 RepID=A0A915BXZ2_PARUN